jgi:hypothetical protein
MEAMTPDTAVAFATHRMKTFRNQTVASVAGDVLFPFTEADIRQAVSTGAVANQQPGPVTLRVLNRVLHDALKRRLTELDPAFDIRPLPAGALAQQRLKIAEAYRVMIQVAA